MTGRVMNLLQLESGTKTDLKLGKSGTSTRTRSSKTQVETTSPSICSYKIRVEWSEDGECYMAASDDIQGLILETDDLDTMEVEMRDIIPWLLEGNHNVSVSSNDIKIKKNQTGERKVFSYTVSHAI